MLGIKVAYSKQGIFVSQRKYMFNLLKETWTRSKPSSTPIDPNHRISQDKKGKAVDTGCYQQLVERLIYLSHTWPMLHMLLCYKLVHAWPKGWALSNGSKILWCLKFTLGRVILYKKEVKLTVEWYNDIDYTRSLTDKRFTNGYCTYFARHLVIWRHKKQNIIAWSSAEAKFQVVAHEICELLWL